MCCAAGAGTTLVVDADAEAVADRLGVEHHGRQLTVGDQPEAVGVECVAVDDHPVDQGVAEHVGNGPVAAGGGR